MGKTGLTLIHNYSLGDDEEDDLIDLAPRGHEDIMEFPSQMTPKSTFPWEVIDGSLARRRIMHARIGKDGVSGAQLLLRPAQAQAPHALFPAEDGPAAKYQAVDV